MNTKSIHNSSLNYFTITLHHCLKDKKMKIEKKKNLIKKIIEYLRI